MKDRIVAFLDAQLGRMLLVLAVAWTVAAIYLNGAQPVPDTLTKVPNDPVKVLLDTEQLAALGAEQCFAMGPGEKYSESTRYVFVPEKVEVVFHPVDLDVPPIGILRPPQILPEPGPSLEGADKLPRFGDEFPPLTLTVVPPPAAAIAAPAPAAGAVAPVAGKPGALPATTPSAATPAGKTPAVPAPAAQAGKAPATSPTVSKIPAGAPVKP